VEINAISAPRITSVSIWKDEVRENQGTNTTDRKIYPVIVWGEVDESIVAGDSGHTTARQNCNQNIIVRKARKKGFDSTFVLISMNRGIHESNNLRSLNI
jgi:hypothetical protein